MTTGTPGAERAVAMPAGTITIGWALRRALLGIVIMFVVISTAAWLLHASIDPSLEADGARAFAPASATAKPLSTGSLKF
jgi:hypothetical protein